MNQITEAEIDRRYKTGDKFFEQGVELGMKSFDHFISISAGALGLLLTLKSGVLGRNLELTKEAGIVFAASILFFVITIISSIFRNYFAGNGLVRRGERFIEKCNVLQNKDRDLSLGRHAIAKMYETKAEFWRKISSNIARFSFIIAIGLLAMMIIFKK